MVPFVVIAIFTFAGVSTGRIGTNGIHIAFVEFVIIAFVNVGTAFAIAQEPCVAFTGVGGIDVGTGGILIAVVAVGIGTLINIVTGFPIAFPAVFTGTSKTARCIGAVGMVVTGV